LISFDGGTHTAAKKYMKCMKKRQRSLIIPVAINDVVLLRRIFNR
jgi:hypothetical protein